MLTLTPEASADIVRAAKRRSGPHNARRRLAERLLWEHFAEQVERRSNGGGTRIRSGAAPAPSSSPARRNVEPKQERWDLGEAGPDERTARMRTAQMRTAQMRTAQMRTAQMRTARMRTARMRTARKRRARVRYGQSRKNSALTRFPRASSGPNCAGGPR